ncbi:hypothetical protein FNV43_RR06059 [Rhamnella rubrinervis]|uniref:Uncharacterized protein n=1 Tax=Rhamnella rubrinervis TaxID=2594499 RepID=A0A8K0HCW0_9ROSA|nr:hypothetical protein FNV43_RR06059 [Rhamnella rubrinervis]
MDESWRMRMGMPTPALPRRHSTEHAPTRRSLFSDSEDALDPEDFADVFGGPPRSVLWRKPSGDFANSASSFYEEIFRPPDFGNPSVSGGRSLSAFRIPVRTSDGFYSDVFGSDDERRSRERSRPNSKAKSKSKSNSSSVLSSEELSPLRPVFGDDVALSSFASKLRPINVPYRWNSITMMPTEENISKKQTQFMENDDHSDNYFIRSSYNFGFSRRVSSPETISLEPNSYQSVKLSVDDFDHDHLNSPSSAVSSIYQETEAKSGIDHDDDDHHHDVPEAQQEDDDDDDEVISSYVIEINSDYRDQGAVCDAVGIDEAIAWAKEKFQKHSNSTSEEDLRQRQDYEQQSVETDHGDEGRPNPQIFSDDQMDKHGMVQSPEAEKQRKWTSEELDQKQCTELKDMEMEVLDDNVRLWSAGKETNIRLLLSTLHYILWPTSGWYAIPLTSLIESSQVKKAYQKARLCLHPDKLQQRGATIKQKYIADKAFSILQDAWASFISQDVFF